MTNSIHRSSVPPQWLDPQWCQPNSAYAAVIWRLTFLTVILAYFFFFDPNPTLAGENHWTPQELVGGTVLTIAVDPQIPSVVYAGTSRGLFKSIDNGLPWTSINSGLTASYANVLSINTLAINPSDPSIIYAGTNTGGGIFKSTNGGISWININTGLTTPYVQSLAIDPVSTDTLYAGTYGVNGLGGVYKSTNGGTTWTPTNNGLPIPIAISTVMIDPKSPNIIYAGTTTKGIYKSTNGGASWAASNVGLNDTYVKSIAINPASTSTIYVGTRNGLFKSTTGGMTWSPANTGLTNLDILTVIMKNTTELYAGTDGGGLYKSIDGGATWNSSNDGLYSTFIRVLAFEPGSSTTFYAGTDGGVFKSTNSGGVWSAVNDGLPRPNIESLVVDPIDPAILYAGTAGGGVFKSVNSGGSWTSSSTGLTNTNIRSLAIDYNTPTTLYAGTFYGKLFKSSDGGTTWGPLSNGLSITDFRALVIDPITPTILYAGTQAGIFKTIDSGTSWSQMNTGLTTREVASLAIDPVTPDTLYAGTIGSGVFRSTDGGATWQANNNGLTNLVIPAIVVDPGASNIIYAGTEGMLFKSNNSGLTWTEANLPYNVISFAFDSTTTPITIYAGTEGNGVFKSVDSATTWITFNKGLEETSYENYFRALALTQGMSPMLYAGTGDGVFDYQTSNAPLLDLNGPSFGLDYQTSFIGFGSTAAVDSAYLTLNDLDSSTLNTATITITNLIDNGAEVIEVNTSGTNITASYSITNGVLSLIGSDTITNYRQVLQSTTYENVASNLSRETRTIEFVVYDGAYRSPLAQTDIAITFPTFLPIVLK